MSGKSKSELIFEKASQFIPGGVSSANRLIEPNLVFTRAEGAYIYDADGKRYIDYHAAFGPPILGHCHPEVNERVNSTLSSLDLVGVGANHLEAELAEKITKHVPSADKVMFCNSGSEATYSALRLARAATGRRKIIKFQGCYHGWHDAILMNVISPPDKIGKKDPISAGMTPEVVDDTLVLTFNDVEELSHVITEHADEIAGVILEPIPHNVGAILPRTEFLIALRELTKEYGIVLIFDEVITGFRHGLGGYQKIADVTPDLTTLGKAIANGYPLAALCGREDLMQHCRPGGDVFFAGTFNAHPMGIAASLATVEILERPETHQYLLGMGQKMRDGLETIYQKHGLETYVTGFGSVFLTYFMAGPITDYRDVLNNDVERFVSHRRKLIDRGIYELPVNLKRNHISLAHTGDDIAQTLDTVDTILKEA